MSDRVTRPDRSQLGFWIYIMTDCMLFASLFAVYAVLQVGTAGGPSPRDIFELPLVLTETLLLLASSFMVGMALWARSKQSLRGILSALVATYLLGVGFLLIELYEFSSLVESGHDWTASAFLSAFFVLVGTHGLHIFVGLIWLVVLVVLLLRRGLNDDWTKKLGLFALFWHFLDLVWIFIFTVVYLVGVAL